MDRGGKLEIPIDVLTSLHRQSRPTGDSDTVGRGQDLRNTTQQAVIVQRRYYLYCTVEDLIKPDMEIDEKSEQMLVSCCLKR
jgi:hypothetical protein